MQKHVARSTLYQLIEAGQMARAVLLRPLHEYGLHPGDDAIILALKNKHATLDNDLCPLTGLTAKQLQPRIDRLLALSFVQRITLDENFAPATRLTKDGRKIQKKLVAHWRELEAALMDDLSHKDKKNLRKSMRRFADLLAL